MAIAPQAGGHGDHWGCIYRAAEREAMIALVRRTVAEDAKPDNPASGVQVYRTSGDGIGACVLVAGGQVVSAYPDLRGGAAWPVTVREVVPWARRGVEGQVVGECMGAEVSFFDTRFYSNGGRYRVGETYDFRMAALAYNLSPAGELEAESGEGDTKVKVSLKGASAYMPAAPGLAGAEIDDYWFHSPLGDEPPAAVEFDGRRLAVYSVTLAVPNDFEMGLPLYAARHSISPEMATIEPGADVTGYLWLQGYLDMNEV